MYVSINGPDDPDLSPFDLETGMRVASKVGNRPSVFAHVRPFGSRITRRSLCTRRTDGQMNGQNQRLLPPSLRTGHNNLNVVHDRKKAACDLSNGAIFSDIK